MQRGNINRNEASAGISNSDVLGNPHFDRFAFTRCNDSTRVGEVQGQHRSGRNHLLLLQRSHGIAGIRAGRLNEVLTQYQSVVIPTSNSGIAALARY
jgi:hypothetical protein